MEVSLLLRRLALPQLNRDARLLIAVSGLFAISFYGINALLIVLYVLRLGHGPQYVGWFSASSALSYMAMSLPAGALGKRYGTRQVMLVGGALTAAGIAMLPLAEFVAPLLRNAWPILAQVCRNIGWAMLNVNLVPALMAATTAENRNSTYAYASAFRGLGTFLGTMVGGVLPSLFAGLLGQTLDVPGPYRLSIWTGAAIALVGLAPIALIHRIGHVTSEGPVEHSSPFPTLLVALTIGHVYFAQGGWATCQAFYNAYLDTQLRLPAWAIGAITSIGYLMATFAPMLAPRLALRRSNGWTLMVTTAGTAVSLMPLALLPHWLAAGLGRLGVSALAAIWLPALQVFQMEAVESQWRSLAYGAVSTAMALSFASVSIAGGYIASAAGYGSLFLVGAGLSVAGTVVMWATLKRRAEDRG
jgi:MFS family permease